MKKSMTKMLCLALAGCMGLASFAACDIGVEDVVEYDKTKTQLQVVTYMGGVGRNWLDTIAKQFEIDYEGVPFESDNPEKKGVEVVVAPAENSNIDGKLDGDSAVLFTENITYKDYVAASRFLDITDIVTEPLSNIKGSETETATIESKMYDGQKEALKFSGNKYYAIPHYATFAAVTYNKALFNTKGLYFAKRAKGAQDPELLADYFISTSNTVKSCGPDGLANTSDDGLPATWEEFLILCDYMAKEKGVDPFIWATGGKETHYLNYLLNAVYLNLAGKDQARVNFTYDSKGKTIDVVTKWESGQDPEISPVAIDASNAYLLKQQLAKYQALEVAEKIYTTDAYNVSNYSGSDLANTQRAFVRSYNQSRKIAFLVEGSYWYNEAATIIDGAKDDDPFGFEEANDYQMMPLPHYWEGKAADIEVSDPSAAKKTVVADQADAYAFINANIADDADMVALAKTFLKYCYTDKALKSFTEVTGVPRNLNYEVDLTKLPSDYARSVWNTYKSSDVVVSTSNSDLYLSNRLASSLIIDSNFWRTKTNDLFYSSLGKHVTAKEFFKEMWS